MPSKYQRKNSNYKPSVRKARPTGTDADLNLNSMLPLFTDEDKAREFIESKRWPGGPYCPHCGEMNPYKLEGKADSKKPVRIGHLFKLQGKEHVEVDHLAAGDIGVIPKVDELRFNSVLHSDPGQHFNPPKLPIPRPLFGIAVELKNPADEAKFSTTVHKLMELDGGAPLYAVPVACRRHSSS